MKTTTNRPGVRTYRNLIRRPSFLNGFASIWDFEGNLRRRKFGPDADARALASDWQAVGDALWTAMEQFEKGTGAASPRKAPQGQGRLTPLSAGTRGAPPWA